MSRQFFLSLLFIALLPFASMAQEAEVDVAERGANATEARTKAMAAADRLAFEKIINAKLPKQAKAVLKAYTPEAISEMVLGYEVVTEKMTPNTYRATIKVKFDDAAIEKITGVTAEDTSKENNVAAAAAAVSSSAVLILPVWFDERNILLWETNNGWREMISRVALQADSGQWIVPFGDPTDMVTTDSTQIETAGYEALAPLAARYGAGSILVAIAKPGVGVLDVELRHLTKAGAEKEIVSVQAKDNTTTPEELMKKAAEILLLGDERTDPAALTGKQRAARSGARNIPELHQINLLLHLKQARDWAELNHRLHTIEGVEKLEVVVADWRRMQMKMSYRGDPEDLGEAMAKAGLTVNQSASMLLIGIR